MGPSTTNEYIKLDNITYQYREGNFSLSCSGQVFHRGIFTGIMGANGSGKTTLGKLMAGILKPDQGRVLINKRDNRELKLGEIGKMIGYLFQQPERQLFTPSVQEELGFALNFMGESADLIKEKTEQMLRYFNLEHLKESSSYQLSAGEKQRLALAVILTNEPPYLILDEPTKGLDPLRKKQLANILKGLQEKGIGLAVISHDRGFIEDNADRILQMSGGKISET